MPLFTGVCNLGLYNHTITLAHRRRYLTHFWLRYAKQLSHLTSISPLTAVKSWKRFCSTLGNCRYAH